MMKYRLKKIKRLKNTTTGFNNIKIIYPNQAILVTKTYKEMAGVLSS